MELNLNLISYRRKHKTTTEWIGINADWKWTLELVGAIRTVLRLEKNSKVNAVIGKPF